MANENKDWKKKFEDLTIDENKGLEVRFNNYISHGTGRTDYFEYLRRIYLEINLALMAAFFTIFPLIYNNINNDWFKNTIIIGLSTYLLTTIINIIFYSRVKTEFLSENGKKNSFSKIDSKFRKNCTLEKRSEELKKVKVNTIWRTLWFHRNNVPKIECLKITDVFYAFLYEFAKEFGSKHNIPLKENRVKKDKDQKQKPEMIQKLLKDDIKEIFDIYCHQSNYSRSAMRIRNITLYGLVLFICSLIIGLISLLFR